MGGIQNKYRMLKQIISDTAKSNIPPTNIFIPLPDEEKKAETLSHLTSQWTTELGLRNDNFWPCVQAMLTLLYGFASGSSS